MAYLVKEDLYTHIYEEIIEEITRENDTVVSLCISSAIAEAKCYLSRYDLLKMFGNETIEPEVESEHLKNLVKSIACWALIRLANPNINIELFRMAYEDAIKFLTKVMEGKAAPDGWIYKSDDPATDFKEGDYVQWSSNQKRTQHF